MPSPLCTVQDGSGAPQTTTQVATVTSGNTVTLALADATGVSTWTLTCLSTDETTTAATINAALSVNGTTKTATFVAPGAGQAYIFQSVVNGGKNANNQVDAALTRTFKVATLSSYGTYAVAASETTEHGASGWLPVLNGASRGDTVAKALSFYASFYKSSPDGSVSIYRRGDSIAAPTYQARYVGTIPSSATLSTAGSQLSSTPAAPATASPFESFAFTGNAAASGSDAQPDPSWTVTLQASFNPSKGTVNPALTTTRTLTHTTYWSSDVYFGRSSFATIAAANVYSGSLQSGFQERLQRDRTGSYAIATSTSAEYLYFLWPNESQYTGTPVFYNNGVLFSYTYQGTVSISRNTVTRTYEVYRSTSTVTPNYTHTVVVA